MPKKVTPKKKVGRPQKTAKINSKGMPVLYCNTCNTDKPLSEFNKDTRSAIGYQTRCKVCEKKYREDNSERIEQYFKDNREQIAAGSAEYYRRNRDKIKSWRRNYYANEGHLKVRLASNERHAKKISSSDGTVTPEFIELLFYAQDGCCMSCGKAFENNKGSFHIDHIFPLSKGGEHISGNIQLLCPKCNLKKGSKVVIDMLQRTQELNLEAMAHTIISEMQVGATIEEVCVKMRVSKDTFYKWCEEYEVLTYAKKRGIELAKAWWLEQSRVNLKDKNFSATLFYMNMKNRFGWRDKSEVEHKGELNKIVIAYPKDYIPKHERFREQNRSYELPS